MGNKLMKSSRNETTSTYYELTSSERKMICKCWGELMRLQPDLFTTIWLKAVQRSPSIAETFGIKGQQNPRENKSFIRLTMAVEAFFHRLIVSWGLEEETMKGAIIELGAKHNGYTARGFQAIYWDIFMVCLMDTVELSDLGGIKGDKRLKVIHAWQKLIHTIVEYMRQGYAQGKEVGTRESTPKHEAASS